MVTSSVVSPTIEAQPADESRRVASNVPRSMVVSVRRLPGAAPLAPGSVAGARGADNDGPAGSSARHAPQTVARGEPEARAGVLHPELEDERRARWQAGRQNEGQ